MNDWVISIASGHAQKPLIEAAKKRGYKVMGVDQIPDFDILDDAICTSTYDVDLVLAKIQARFDNEQPQAIIARVSGPAVKTAAAIAEKFGLPGFTLELSNTSVSKEILRQRATKLGVPTLSGQAYNQKPSWQDGWDVVIKPAMPISGKANVYRVNDEAQMSAAFDAAHNESFDGWVEIQNYQTGRDIGLCVAIIDGKVLWHSVFEERVNQVEGRFIGAGVSGPICDTDFEVRLLNVSQRFIGSANCTGFVFFSYRVTEDGELFLYEVNPGLCGDGIVDVLFDQIWPDADFYGMDIAMALGEMPVFPSVSVDVRDDSKESSC